jgi:glycosyltransferase involved in cell wall biosynthesis
MPPGRRRYKHYLMEWKLPLSAGQDVRPDALSQLRVALVHYWFMRRRGGERVVETLAEMFPQADIFALVMDPAWQETTFRAHKVTTSFLQRLPGAKRYYRKLLPLFPFAVEQFRLDDYDLVISSESGPAKGVITGAKTCHICYCFTPMRYLWDMYHQYRAGKGMGFISRAFFSMAAHYVRLWDLATASRVAYVATLSHHVASRIRKHYRRDATVIYPPVAVSAGSISPTVDDYYLVVSPLVDYKRVDLAIEACNQLGRPLRIIGDGEEYRRLRRLAGPSVTFLGYVPDEVVRENYARCRALLFPGEEDFGIVPVEVQSFGRPVIAYDCGGARETVIGIQPGGPMSPENSSGVFFAEQSVDSLVAALRFFESVESRFSPEFIRGHVQRFNVDRFKTEMRAFITEKLAEFCRLSEVPRPGIMSG